MLERLKTRLFRRTAVGSKRKTRLYTMRNFLLFCLLLLMPFFCSSQEHFQKLFDSKAPVVTDEKGKLFRIVGTTTKTSGSAIFCRRGSQNGLLISEVGINLVLAEKFYTLQGKWSKESAVLSFEGKTYYIVPSASGFYLVDGDYSGVYYSYSAFETQRGSDIFLTGSIGYATKDYKVIKKDRAIVPGIQEISNAPDLFEQYPDLKAQAYATKGTYAFVSEKNANYLNSYNNFFYPDNYELVYYKAEEDGKEVPNGVWVQKPNLIRLESQNLGKMTIKLLFRKKECDNEKQFSVATPVKVSHESVKAHNKSDIKVYSSKISVSIMDNATADGDVISLELNGNTVIRNLRLEKCGATFELDLLPGENKLCMKAVTVGSIPPNTALLTVVDVIQKKTIVLKAEVDYFECVTLIR